MRSTTLKWGSSRSKTVAHPLSRAFPALQVPSHLSHDRVVCSSAQVGIASPFFYSAVKLSLNGIEYGDPQYVRFYDQVYTLHRTSTLHMGPFYRMM